MEEMIPCPGSILKMTHTQHTHSPVHQNMGVADECSGQVNLHLVSGGQTADPQVIIFLSTAGWKMIDGWVRKSTRNLCFYKQYIVYRLRTMKVMKGTKNKNTERKKCSKEPEKKKKTSQQQCQPQRQRQQREKEQANQNGKKKTKLNRLRIMNYLLWIAFKLHEITIP